MNEYIIKTGDYGTACLIGTMRKENVYLAGNL